MRADQRVVAALRGVRPIVLLAPLCAAQVAAGISFALSTTHNGWLWYSGGDATEYWAEQWSVGHGLLPHTFLGVGIPALYSWIPIVAGPTLLHGLPVIIVLQLVVGVPLATVGLWLVADRLGGRLFAWWASLVWFLGPLLLTWSFHPDYRTVFVAYFLVPHWYGFTNMADFPSIVLAIWAAWASLRALDTDDRWDAVLAGLLIGTLVVVKPSNAAFVGAPLLAFVLLRRWRSLGLAAAATVPSLLVLALWKERGIGTLPVLALDPHREAATTAPVVGALGNQYLHLNWHELTTKLNEIGDVTWSLRVLEFLAVAGAVGLIRRTPVRGIFVTAWFAGYCLVKGDSPLAVVSQTSYWRLTAPGLVAFALLASATVFLLPGMRRVQAPAAPSRRRRPWPIAAAAVVLVALPLAAVAAATPMKNGEIVRASDNTEAPQSSAFSLRAAGKTLTWNAVDSAGSSAWYAVYRSTTGDGCSYYDPGGRECVLGMEQLTVTHSTTYTDTSGKGRRWYRVSLVASHDAAQPGGDLMLISPAVAVG